MSEKYEHIVNTIDALKTTLNNIVEGDGMTDEELAALTGDQVEAIIKHMNTLCSHDYHKRTKIEDDFKTRYLELPLLQDTPKLIQTILSWGETDKWSNEINKYNSHIMKYLTNISTQQLSDSSGLEVGMVNSTDTSRIYRSIWLSIVKKTLFLNKEHVSLLVKENPRFIEYVITSQIAKYNSKKPVEPSKEQTAKKQISSQDSDNEYYDVDEYNYNYDGHRKNINMSYVESFMVSLLMSTNKFDDDTTQLQKIFTMYQIACHTKLQHFPMKVTRFSGEILAPILAHYSNPANYISPIVKNRRTVGVVLDNKPYRYHKYEDVFKRSGKDTNLYTTSIAIEFPYMCYICVSHVELELNNEIQHIASRQNINISVTVETDYVLVDFRKYTKEDKTDENTYNKKQSSIIKRVDCKNPNKTGVYVSLYFSILGAFVDIKDIRIYGEAISFV